MRVSAIGNMPWGAPDVPETADGWRLAIHGVVQDALGWLTPAEVGEVVEFAIREALDDAVVSPEGRRAMDTEEKRDVKIAEMLQRIRV